MSPGITIVGLSTERVDDYLAFFDRAFVDNPRWAGCYCGYYDDPCADDEWDPAGGAARNRSARAERIRSGLADGVLAYEGDQVVGWCNAARRSSFGNLRGYEAAVEDAGADPGLVMCFVVDPARRSAGVATALLHGALEAFGRMGLAWAEAYPRRTPPASAEFPWAAANFKGSLSMYEKAGFRIHRELEHSYVVRRPLR